jgi:hypothetical protein
LRHRVLVFILHCALAAADGGAAGADFNHGSLDNIIDLLTNLLNFILAVEVPLHDLVCLNETVKLALQLVVLLSEETLVAIQGVKLLSQVIVSLDQGLVGVAHAF